LIGLPYFFKYNNKLDLKSNDYDLVIIKILVHYIY